MAYDLIIKNGVCVSSQGTEQVDIAVQNGKIVAMGAFGAEDAADVIDAKGLHVLPGVIDSQVHFREPGLEYKEDLESGTRAAVMGGVTAVFEMPNTNPPTTNKQALQDKLDLAAGRAWCDHAFFIGGTPEKGVDWHELEILPGCSGIKIFMGASTGSLLVEEDEAIREIFSHSSRRIAVHAEDNQRLTERKHLAEEGKDPKFHPIWRDEESALRATKRVVAIARETKHPAQVLHITTAEEMEFLAKNKDAVSVEVLPQHLTLTADDYGRLGTRLQMNPPIRDSRHRDALWKAVSDGTVDVLGSDHAPHTLEEKAKEYPASPAGMPGVQTLVPVMLNHVHDGKLSLEKLVDIACHNPARLYKVQGKGGLVVGHDADFTIVDLKRTQVIEDSMMEYKCGWTPYDGMKVTGWPVRTVIRGQTVMEDGALVAKNIGQPVRFVI